VRKLLFVVAVCLGGVTPASGSEVFDHRDFDAILRERVDDAGRVDYAGLKANREGLDAYVGRLAKVSPKSHPGQFLSEQEKLAYWINAYNALTLKGVIGAYPTKSVKDIKYLSGFFNRTWFMVGGESYTLNNIEHDVIRKEFKEPRIHAAINCASIGCPRLERQAFFAEGLEERLEAAMRTFLNESRNATVNASAKTVTLSKIFDWFESDFTEWYIAKYNVDDAHILDYVALYLGENENRLDSSWKVKYHAYDWALNDQNSEPE